MTAPVQTRAHKIMFVAGETSGDMHASAVIRALRENCDGTPGKFEFIGMGLEKMERAGMRQLVDTTGHLSLAGIVEPLLHYPKIRKAYRNLTRALAQELPDLLVLVDYPEFNLKLASHANRLGVKVLFYISPQIWAWRKSRIKTIAERVDMMAVIFPFEEKIYRDAGVPVRYVGHPLIDEIQGHSSLPGYAATGEKVVRERATGKKILLMPGSRMVEVKRLLPVLCQAAAKIAARAQTVRFSLALAANIPKAFVSRQLHKHRLQCELVDASADTMRSSDVAITASGTATLQLACHGVPMVIIYKLSWLTYGLLKRLVKVPRIGLVNIVAGKPVVAELIQNEATADNICSEVHSLLDNENHVDQVRRELEKVKRALGNGGTAEKVARLICDMTETGKTGSENAFKGKPGGGA